MTSLKVSYRRHIGDLIFSFLLYIDTTIPVFHHLLDYPFSVFSEYINKNKIKNQPKRTVVSKQQVRGLTVTINNENIDKFNRFKYLNGYFIDNLNSDTEAKAKYDYVGAVFNNITNLLRDRSLRA